ncbi:MAG: hypothetical protein Q8R90_02495 [Bacteroidales bacterium]|nr:hypothetical protein [Bacteroidales bacterium]
MPIYDPNIKFSDCWSSVGNITFYHRNGKCYWRSKPTPVFPGTMRQMEHQSVHLRALASWRTLTQEEQLQWSVYAKDVVARRPPFLNENHISGYNLFVSAYHGFATLGNEHIPVPTNFEKFPPFYAEFVSAEVVGNTNLILRFSLFVGCSDNPMRYKTLGKIQLVKPGRGCHPGKLRNYLSVDASPDPLSPRIILFDIKNYRSVWGLDLPEYTLHIRYLLIDSLTGFRNYHHKLSCSFSL